ncbi:MAG: hypothetical protein WC832_13760 [Anaerolineales bacterium]
MYNESSNLQSPHERLTYLRDKLNQINVPSYPEELLELIKEWISEATPIIHIDWPEAFDDFNSCVTTGGWTHGDMATFVDMVNMGSALPDSQEHRQAWEKDVKEAQELQKKALKFLDGLLRLPSHRQENSFQSDQSIQYLRQLCRNGRF